MKLHNKKMLTLLLMYKITHIFLISLRIITSMTRGEKIAFRAVDIQELIKKKPTFEDVEDEEEDDTMGNYDSD